MVALAKELRCASSTDPATWRSLDEALAALETGRYAGIGRVIEEDSNLVGVDLDDCIDLSTGEISPRAWQILEGLDSYTEVSPSGAGLKIWVKAEQLKIAHTKPGLEVYPKGRYFTVTGQFLSQCPATIEERGAELEALIHKEFPKPKKRTKAYTGPAGKTLDLDEFLAEIDVEITAMVNDMTAALKYRILCPWVAQHTNRDTSGTYIGQYDNGALFFRCHHAHCAGRGWRDFRPLFDPECYVPWWVKVVSKDA